MRDAVETPRLRLRPFRRGDLDAYARWHADPALMAPMSMTPYTRERSEAQFERHLRHWEEHGFGVWAVEEKESGAVVGRAGPAYHRVWPHDPEVGWLIDVPWQGRGFATEAGAASIRYVFDELGFDRVVSICTPENAVSRRVMAKLGLRLFREVDDPELGLPLWVHAIDRYGP